MLVIYDIVDLDQILNFKVTKIKNIVILKSCICHSSGNANLGLVTVKLKHLVMGGSLIWGLNFKQIRI